MRICIAGDSFAAEWPNATQGWVNLLADKFDVINLAQAGVGEYKIYKQLCSVDLSLFDYVIVSHTSPSRIHTPAHPLHKNGFHKNCDLIITDLLGHWNPFNRSLAHAKFWFKEHYDETYQQDIYKLLRQQINDLISVPYISMSHIAIANQLSIEKHHMDFGYLWSLHRGNVNHYDIEGNIKIFNQITTQILKVSQNEIMDT